MDKDKRIYPLTDEEIDNLDLESEKVKKLMEQYQKETNKYAIWRGWVTVAFKKWLRGEKIDTHDKERISHYKEAKAESSNDVEVLLIDDDLAILRLITSYFESKGVTCKGVVSGTKGLYLLRNFLRPKVVLTNITGPDMTGFEVCKMIKSDPDLKNIPVIYFTAHPASEVEKRLEDTKADGYICKPFNFSDFDKIFDLLNSNEEKVGDLFERYDEFIIYEIQNTGGRKRLDIKKEDLGKQLEPDRVLIIIREDLRQIYLWKGAKSSVRKRFISSRVAQDIQNELRHRCKIVSIAQGEELQEFLKTFKIESTEVTERLPDKDKEKDDRERNFPFPSIPKPPGPPDDRDERFPYPYIYNPPHPPDDIKPAFQAQRKIIREKEEPSEELDCPYCGYKIPKGQKFCPICGKDVF